VCVYLCVLFVNVCVWMITSNCSMFFASKTYKFLVSCVLCYVYELCEKSECEWMGICKVKDLC